MSPCHRGLNINFIKKNELIIYYDLYFLRFLLLKYENFLLWHFVQISNTRLSDVYSGRFNMAYLIH